MICVSHTCIHAPHTGCVRSSRLWCWLAVCGRRGVAMCRSHTPHSFRAAAGSSPCSTVRPCVCMCVCVWACCAGVGCWCICWLVCVVTHVCAVDVQIGMCWCGKLCAVCCVTCSHTAMRAAHPSTTPSLSATAMATTAATTAHSLTSIAGRPRLPLSSHAHNSNALMQQLPHTI